VKNRLEDLDALRGIAVVFVVLYHYFFRYNEIYGHQDINTGWAEYGYLGVQLFFIISGFVIFYSIQAVSNKKTFWYARLSRLYPSFIFSVWLTFIVVSILTLPGREIEFTQALGNILLIHEYFSIKHVDKVYWSLTLEMTFYFWIALRIGKSQLKNQQLVLAVSILMLAVSLIQPEVSRKIEKLFLLEYANLFLAGICFYYLKFKLMTYISWLSLAVSYVTVYFIYSFEEFLIITSFYIVMLLFSYNRTHWIKLKPLTYLGSISYALYLIHQNIGYAIIRSLKLEGLSSFEAILVALLVVSVLAHAITSYIEKPAQSYLRKRILKS
jgi:peptidoglycan/LPS O-acetylase OafA/YrhL